MYQRQSIEGEERHTPHLCHRLKRTEPRSIYTVQWYVAKYIDFLQRHRFPSKSRPVSCLHCAHPSPAKCNCQL